MLYDSNIVVESAINKEWWQQFKQRLEQVFDREEILARLSF